MMGGKLTKIGVRAGIKMRIRRTAGMWKTSTKKRSRRLIRIVKSGARMTRSMMKSGSLIETGRREALTGSIEKIGRRKKRMLGTRRTSLEIADTRWIRKIDIKMTRIEKSDSRMGG